MGGSSGGKSSTTTSTKVELPKWAEPYAMHGLGQSWDIAHQPYEQYGGQRIAPLTSQQQQGLQMTEEMAKNNPLTQAATQQSVDTLSGKYLDPSTNPAWQAGSKALSDAYRTGTAATRNAAFSKANAFGADNSAFNQYAGMQDEAFGNSLGQLWGDIYNQERGNQLKQTALAPGLSQAEYQNAQSLIGAGDAYRQYNQDILNLGYDDWLMQKDYPFAQQERFASLFPAFLGNQGTTTARGPNPYQSSPMAGAIGGGLLGYGASTMIPALGPYGIPLAAAGALMGGLL